MEFRSGYTRWDKRSGKVVVVPTYVRPPQDQSLSPSELPPSPSYLPHLPAPEVPPASGGKITTVVKDFLESLDKSKTVKEKSVAGIIKAITVGVRELGKAHLITLRGRPRVRGTDVVNNRVVVEEASGKSIDPEVIASRFQLANRIRQALFGRKAHIYRIVRGRTIFDPDIILILGEEKILYLRYWHDRDGLLGKKGFLYLSFCSGRIVGVRRRVWRVADREEVLARIIVDHEAFVYVRNIKRVRTSGRVTIDRFGMVPIAQLPLASG